jgi:hypothetical protein
VLHLGSRFGGDPRWFSPGGNSPYQKECSWTRFLQKKGSFRSEADLHAELRALQSQEARTWRLLGGALEQSDKIEKRLREERSRFAFSIEDKRNGFTTRSLFLCHLQNSVVSIQYSVLSKTSTARPNCAQRCVPAIAERSHVRIARRRFGGERQNQTRRQCETLSNQRNHIAAVPLLT